MRKADKKKAKKGTQVPVKPVRLTELADKDKETWMTKGTIQEQVMTRAIKDPAFRQELLTNPKAVLAREYDFHLPEHVTVRVLEEAPHTFTLVLPTKEEAMQELTDADLEAAIGGLAPIPTNSGNLRLAC